MNSVKLSDLKRMIFRRAAILPIPGLGELLSLNDDISADEILYELIRVGLRRFEFCNPLVTTSKVYIDKTKENRFEFINNFDAYLEGRVPEDLIEMIPQSIIGIGLTPNMISQELHRRIVYDRPVLSNFLFSTGVYYVRAIYDRPIIEDYDEETKKFSDKARIYYIIPNVGSDYMKFEDFIYVEVLRYIHNLKTNMEVPGLPIQIFNAVDSTFNKLESELEQYSTSSLNNGSLII